ncbi:MAG: type II toxin-antitoxin system HicA family toxin [Patescibacteria group bacterium]
MAKLNPLPQKAVIKILEDNGFRQVRSGKHLTFKKETTDEKILTTWVPQHREVTVFVIKYIIRQTEKPKAEFET